MLTKYPGALALVVIGSYVILFERDLLKRAWFWALFPCALLVFAPWIIWHWRVYSNIVPDVVGAHRVDVHLLNVVRVLLQLRGILLLAAAGLAIWFMARMRKPRGSQPEAATADRATQKRLLAAGLVVCALGVAVNPVLRSIIVEAFTWKRSVLVAWVNPFRNAAWFFYPARLVELSPLYLFAFLACTLPVRRHRGDRLLLWTSVVLLAVFLLLGNYQMRYILPAIPFLVLLAARWLTWVYDRYLSEPSDERGATSAARWRRVGRICLMVVVAYMFMRTLLVVRLIAFPPDFGYF